MKQVDQDPVVYESALKKEQFSYNKVRTVWGSFCLHKPTGKKCQANLHYSTGYPTTVSL